MKLALSLNDTCHTIAEIDAHGYLGAFLNLRQSTEGDEYGSIQITGHDLTDKTSTKFIEWSKLEVKPGDVVKIQIQPEQEATSPTSTTETSKNITYQFLTLEQATEILASVESQIHHLTLMLEKMRATLPSADFKQLALSIGHTMTTYYDKIKRPIYRCHPSLLPKELEDYSL